MADFEARFWKDLLDYAKSIYSTPVFDVWVGNASLDYIANNEIHINIASQTAKKKWEKDLMGKIIELAYQYTGEDMLPVFHYPDADQQSFQQPTPTQSEQLKPIMEEKEAQLKLKDAPHEVPKELLEKAHLQEKFTFETFVESDNTRLAYSAAKVALSTADMYNPMLIYGGTGLGKTHLMQAMGHSMLARNPNAIVRYVSCSDFINEYITSLRNNNQANAMENFQKYYRNVDLLLVDDIQFLEGKSETQTEFFNTFEAIHNHNGQIVMTSDRPVDDIPTLQSRLISRFKSGISCDIQPPDFETRIAILKEKAELRGLDLPENGFEFIANQITSNVRELEGALNIISLYIKTSNITDVSVDVINRALANIATTTKQEVTILKIQEVVSQYYHLKITDLTGKKRNKEIVLPRQIAMYLSRELTDNSLPKIGKEFGGKDHTTVMHSCDKIQALLKQDDQLLAIVDEIKHKINQP